MLYNSIEELIGNTPLLKISEEITNLRHINLYAKLEYYNPFGSMKDRIAYGMLLPYLDEIKEKSKTVLESSSGNTAKALSVLCSTRGIPFKAVSNRIKYPEIRQVLQVLNANLEELPGLSDCADPHDPNDSIQYTKNLVNTNPESYTLTDQYYNQKNIDSHTETTGKELNDDLGRVDFLFAFLGTCGSSKGTGIAVKEKNSNAKIYGIVSEPGNNIPGGRNMNELWEVGLFDKNFYAEILAGNTNESVDGILELTSKIGIMGGPTAGLVYIKALEKLRLIDQQLDKENVSIKKNAVILVGDRFEPYLSFLQKHRPNIFDVKSNRITPSMLSRDEIMTSKEINSKELADMLSDDESIIIDIRGQFAYTMGHIPGSINIVDSLFSQLIESGHSFPQDKKIIIVCRIGDISKKFAKFLEYQGYDAYSLSGGIQEYKKLNQKTSKIQNISNLKSSVACELII